MNANNGLNITSKAVHGEIERLHLLVSAYRVVHYVVCTSLSPLDAF